MRYFRKMRRQMMADRANWHLGDGREVAREALLLVFTDEQLRAIDSREKSRRGLRWLPEAILDLWDKDDVDFSSEKIKKLERIRDMIILRNRDYYEESRPSEYLDDLRSIAATYEQVKVKYGDPSKDGYKVAVDSLSEISCYVQASLIDKSLNDEGEYPLSASQVEGIVAAMFLLRQSGGDEFYPSLSAKEVSTSRWLTKKILDSPDEVEIHLAAFHDRINRLQGFLARLGGLDIDIREYDIIGDYPDELIDRLIELRFSNFLRFADFCRYVVTDSEKNSQQTVDEVLCFMGAFDDLNMRYLSWAIPSLLRSYECLPPMEDYSKATGVLREQCEALLLVSITISTELSSEARKPLLNNDKAISDQRLVNLLMKNPERASFIAKTVKERKIADFESLNQVSSGVLGDGNL